MPAVPPFKSLRRWSITDLHVNTNQIELRSLFVITLFAALATIALQFIASHAPEMFIFAIMFSAVVALAGLGLIGFALLMTFSILLTPDDGERRRNLYRCGNLVWIGSMAIVPLLIWFLILPLTM